MRLDPAGVRYIPPVFDFRLVGGGLRFVGKQNNIQLTETALVCEGRLLKVTLLGLEVYFREALSEWSSVTIPFSRIDDARQVRWPWPRIVAAVCVVLCIPTLWGPFLALYLVWRLRGHYRVRFRDRTGTTRTLRFRIKDRAAREAFDRRLSAFRAAAKKRTSASFTRLRSLISPHRASI